MADNPLKGFLGEMSAQLRTRPADLDEVARLRKERQGSLDQAEGPEPGEPTRTMAED